MTGVIHDLLTERHKRRRNPLAFETDSEALAFVIDQLDDLRDLTTDQLLIPTETVQLHIGQVRAVVAACLDLYDHHSERDSR